MLARIEEDLASDELGHDRQRDQPGQGSEDGEGNRLGLDRPFGRSRLRVEVSYEDLSSGAGRELGGRSQ